MKTEEIDAMLVEKFPRPAWALFFEFPSATGAVTIRRCDALAFSLFPSQGLEVIGVEVKVSRSDWLNELKNPLKANAVGQYCDRWFIAAPKDVVKVEEMPPVWGLMVPRGGKLVIVKQAEKLPAKPMEKRFIMSLMRQIHEKWLPRKQVIAELEAERKSWYDRGFENGKRIVIDDSDKRILEQKIRAAEYELSTLKKSIEAFENKSGIKFETWNMGNVGMAVQILVNMHNGDNWSVYNRAREVAQQLKHVQSALKALIDQTNPAPEAKEGPFS